MRFFLFCGIAKERDRHPDGLRQFQITRSLNNPYAGSLWTTIAANCSISSPHVSGWADAACSPMMAKAIMTKEIRSLFAVRRLIARQNLGRG
jgi:hypothetical protein